MIRLNLYNAGAALVAVFLAVYFAGARPGLQSGNQPVTAPPTAAPSMPEEVRDATGFALRPANFRRVASGSIVVDRLLLALCEPDRVVAFSVLSGGESP